MRCQEERTRGASSGSERIISNPCRRWGLCLPAFLSLRFDLSECFRPSIQNAVLSYSMSRGVRANPILALSRPNQRLKRLETGRPYKCFAAQAVEEQRVERGIDFVRNTPRGVTRGLENAPTRYCRHSVNINIIRSFVPRTYHKMCFPSMKFRLFLLRPFVKFIFDIFYIR